MEWPTKYQYKQDQIYSLVIYHKIALSPEELIGHLSYYWDKGLATKPQIVRNYNKAAAKIAKLKPTDDGVDKARQEMELAIFKSKDRKKAKGFDGKESNPFSYYRKVAKDGYGNIGRYMTKVLDEYADNVYKTLNYEKVVKYWEEKMYLNKDETKDMDYATDYICTIYDTYDINIDESKIKKAVSVQYNKVLKTITTRVSNLFKTDLKKFHQFILAVLKDLEKSRKGKKVNVYREYIKITANIPITKARLKRIKEKLKLPVKSKTKSSTKRRASSPIIQRRKELKRNVKTLKRKWGKKSKSKAYSERKAKSGASMKTSSVSKIKSKSNSSSL